MGVMSTTNLKPCRTNNTYKFITVLFKEILSRCQTIYFIMILLSIYIYNWIGNKFLQLTSSSPYKYSNSINKTNQMTANVQAISIISKLNKVMSN
jgi:hypothetical protein